MTELIVSTERASSLSSTVDPVFSVIRDKILTLCTTRPTLQVVLAPPLYRPLPLWYRDNLAQVATKFSACFGRDRPENLHLLPSFVSQDLCPDGVLLTPVSGLHFVLYLFDETLSALKAVETTPDTLLVGVLESVRAHDDRLAYIEHDHSRLHHRVDRRVAIESEFSDWVTNRSEEDWITIKNLPRLSPDLNRQEWQVEAKKQVRDALRLAMNALKVNVDIKVLVVSNPFRHRNTGPTLYNVRLGSFESSRRIRDSFSGFFRHANPVKRPSSLKGISFNNKVTLNTRIRAAIMRQLGERYIETNRGATYKVRGYESRPTMIVTPPASSKSRPRTYNFIEAVTMLPAHFSDEQLTQIFMIVGQNNRGLLRQLFLVLDDDDHDRCLELVKKHHEQRQAQNFRGESSRSRQHVSFSGTQSHTANFSGPGAGMETEGLRQLLSASPPPPPPPVGAGGKDGKSVSPPRKGRAGKTSRTKAKKRDRSPSRSPTPRRRSESRTRSASRSPTPRRSPKKRYRRSRSGSSGSGESSADDRVAKKKSRSRRESLSDSTDSDRGSKKKSSKFRKESSRDSTDSDRGSKKKSSKFRKESSRESPNRGESVKARK